MRTGRGLNDRLGTFALAKRNKREKKAAYLLALAKLSPRDYPEAKLDRLAAFNRFVVSLCRCTPHHEPLDDDNLRGSLKAFRDGLCRRLGIDDGDTVLLRFEYSQKVRVPWGIEFTVSVESRPT